MIELNKIYVGNCLEIMRSWPDAFVQTVVTSPPYWGLRDYGVAGQIGLEADPGQYVAKMVEVFREVRRVLRDDGTLWLNLGDSYASAWPCSRRNIVGQGPASMDQRRKRIPRGTGRWGGGNNSVPGLKEKDQIFMPHRVAMALQVDGWYARSTIVWEKPNPMPESVEDRPTTAHEYIFLMAKSEHYYYDADAIKEPATETSLIRLAQNVEMQEGSARGNGGTKTNGRMKAVGCKPFGKNPNRRDSGRECKPLPEGQAAIRVLRDKQRGHGRRHDGFNDRWDAMEKSEQCGGMRNKRSVWRVATMPFKEAHFATFPPKLIKPCILAGSMGGGVVLDPFMGAGTTALVALQYNRQFLGIELNPGYAIMAETRIANERAQVKLAI